MEQLLSKQSAVFSRVDPYVVSDYVNEHMGNHRLQLPRTKVSTSSLMHRKLAGLDMFRISYGSDVRITSPGLETFYHLQMVLLGQCLWRCHSHEYHLRAGDIFLINPDDQVDLTSSSDCEKFILKVPSSLLLSICGNQDWSIPKEGLRFVKAHYRMADLEGFSDLLRLVCAEAEVTEQFPGMHGHYTQIVASKMLALMETNLVRLKLGSTHAKFDQIVDYIERNLKGSLSGDELARQANMSTRSLYGLFDRSVGMTPNRYIRQKRLERVHASLSDVSSKYRNITELAMEYGFLHLGRFSEIYRKQFGELPTETLRRRCD